MHDHEGLAPTVFILIVCIMVLYDVSWNSSYYHNNKGMFHQKIILLHLWYCNSGIHFKVIITFYYNIYCPKNTIIYGTINTSSN